MGGVTFIQSSSPDWIKNNPPTADCAFSVCGEVKKLEMALALALEIDKKLK
jgi:hypothetical protein